MSELPKGWIVVTLGEVCSKPQYGYTTKSCPEGRVQYLRTTDLSSGKVNWGTVPYCLTEPDKVDKYQLEHNDIVISRAGSVGYHHLIKSPPNNAVFASYLIRFKPLDCVEPRYLSHFLNSRQYWSQITEHSAGVAVQNVNAKKLASLVLPVAPLDEQKRIADKLDSVLAKVEAAQARLDKIPTILKRFRQSVLAAATSGELTKEWREENDADLEWKRVQVSEIVEKIEAGKSIKCDERPPQNDEFGIIKISAVTWGVYNELESKTLFDKSVFLENRRINVGDFLISRANTIELLGMPVIVHEVTKNLMLSDKVLRLVMDDIDKSWLSFYFRSPEGRKQIENGSSGNQESMRNIGQKALMAIELKNPTKPEKLEIIRRVDELFSKADSVEQQYNAAKACLDKLTQSILKKAFKGELLSSSIDSEVVKALDGDLAMQY
ncbi:MAG: restriction endonuclease subunit S [Alteromonas sp.]|nr:restriction endonuclease subunit S [Alteromonas sp.]|tara:strand:+ start:5883 stop:7190 length:1308 start_codon:yes stop_codon:yes gene_type:complete